MTEELKIAQLDGWDQDMKNDIDKVFFYRDSLRIMIGPWPHLIDTEVFKIYEKRDDRDDVGDTLIN